MISAYSVGEQVTISVGDVAHKFANIQAFDKFMEQLDELQFQLWKLYGSPRERGV